MKRTLLEAGGLATKFSNIAEAEAARMLGEVFGIGGRLTRLATEKDDTFLIDCSDGVRRIAKFSNPDEDGREISLQSELLAHISISDPSLPVPRVFNSLCGSAHVTYVDDARQSRLVRILSYLEGTPLDRIQSSAQEREKVGAMLARLRLAMADFSHPHDSRELAWDVKHLLSLEFLIGQIKEKSNRANLERGLERFENLQTSLAACRTQVVHNDFSRSNIVIDRHAPQFVSGIIDFGDAVRTAIAIDVSTALLNQLSPTGHTAMFQDAADLLRGYLTVADLTDNELGLLPHLVMARVIARALITTWRAEQFPDNQAYIMRNTLQGWVQLDWFLSRSSDEVTSTFFDSPKDW